MTLALTQPTLAPVLGSSIHGLRPGPVLTWGGLDALSLFPSEKEAERARFVAPLAHLQLSGVVTYGTVRLTNTSKDGLLVAPMHVGFFQDGAQNHATARFLLLGEGKTLIADDCFCVQQSQGGLLRQAQQRFLTLPLGLRRRALEERGHHGCGRLWSAIEEFTRRYGVTRGGHLERFLRPYFGRLQPYRHGLEALPGQVGAAFFVGGRLVGVEVTPNAAYWSDLAPVLAIYGYAPSALLARERGSLPAREPLALDGLTDLDDLAERLSAARRHQQDGYVAQVRQALDGAEGWQVEERRHGLEVETHLSASWAGQRVRAGRDVVALSLFSDPAARTSVDGGASDE